MAISKADTRTHNTHSEEQPLKGAAQTMYNTCHHHHPSKVVAFSHLLYFLLYITLPFCEYSLHPSLSLRFLCFLLIACSIAPVYSIYEAPNARGLSQINVSLVFLFFHESGQTVTALGFFDFA